MKTTDTIGFTEAQENKFRLAIEKAFTKQFNLEWNHFSFNGTNLNLKTMNFDCVHEIHTDCGLSLWGIIEVNDKKSPLKRTIRFIEQ